jgi:hypothetical protein
MSLICSKNKWQALIKQVQFHITENVRCLDFDSVGKTVCQPQHCPSLVWRVGIRQKTVRSLRKFAVGRHALTLQIAHLLTSRKEKGTTVYLHALSRIHLEKAGKTHQDRRGASTVFSIRHRYANPHRKSCSAPARQH